MITRLSLLSRDEHSELVTDIKWEVYKAELLWNLGIKIEDSSPQGKLMIYLSGMTIIRSMSINKILPIIQRTDLNRVIRSVEGGMVTEY
mgnify:CR=1 FL=1